MSLRVRYPGRVCLLGEHCDWGGGASLTTTLPLGVTADATVASDGLRVRSALEGHLVEQRWSPEELATFSAGEARPEGPLRFAAAVWAVLHQLGQDPVPAQLELHADLPPGRGFSSSAAVSLAVADALCLLAGRPVTDLPDVAYRAEHDLLGIGCGRLDQLACAAGGPLFLRWTDGTVQTQRVELARTLPLLVAAFEAPRDTPGILAALQAAHGGGLRSGASRAVHGALQRWASGAEVGARALSSGQLPALGEALDDAQAAYEELLEPHLPALRAPGLRRTCAALREAGALGAKFSGAGGDGSVVAVFSEPDHSEHAAVLLRSRGLRAWALEVPAST